MEEIKLKAARSNYIELIDEFEKLLEEVKRRREASEVSEKTACD